MRLSQHGAANPANMLKAIFNVFGVSRRRVASFKANLLGFENLAG
jgi:hypothetical protein